MYREPTAHHVDPDTGAMTGATGAHEKRLRDLEGCYLDAAAFHRAKAAGGDRIVYSVREVRPPQAMGDIHFGTTRIEPGRIGDEFYMTRGHIHAVANRSEVYCGLRGTGVLLLESLEGETRVLDVTPGVAVYVPPMWLHRSVNVGQAPLVMSFYCPSDSGHDYEIIVRSGGMACRIVADGAGWKAVPNPRYRPRRPEEIARVLATRS